MLRALVIPLVPVVVYLLKVEIESYVERRKEKRRQSERED